MGLMGDPFFSVVMAGPAEGRDPAIDVLRQKDVDGRDKHDHDDAEVAQLITIDS
jgi:hypothetical protein